MSYIIKLLFILSSFTVIASDSVQEYKFDDNQDGKIDSIFRYKDGVLTEHLNDRNYDEKFDYRLAVEKSITNVYFDKDYDGNFDYLEMIKNNGDESIYKEYKLVENKKQLLLKRVINNFEHRKSERKLCSYENYLSNIGELEEFVTHFKFIVSSMNQGITPAQSGYQVHKSCFENLGEKKFSSMLTNAINIGISCLTEVAKKNTKETFKGEITNLINYFKIQSSGKVRPITLLCNESDHEWSEQEIAHASVRDTMAKGVEVRHPYVSLNPKIKKTFFGGIVGGPPTDEMEGIIFHEMIHNFGYTHGNGIDLTYGCEVCCFSDDEQAKESACNVCTGNYIDKYDSKYLRDIAKMSKATGLNSAEVYFYRNLSKIPVNQKNIDSLFLSLSNRGPGVQAAFIKQLSFRGKTVSKNKETEVLLRKIENYNPPNNWLRDINRFYAESIVLGFIEKDTVKAILNLGVIDQKELEDVSKMTASDSREAGKVLRGIQYFEYSQ